MRAPNRSVKVPEQQYRMLANKAEATGRKLQWLLARAIDRYCGKPKRAAVKGKEGVRG